MPGATNSVPVDNTSTRCRGITVSSGSPSAAARPSTAGVTTWPALSTVLPAVTSSPARRMCWPGRTLARIVTVSIAPSVASTGTTPVAPDGSGAPVMIRCAVPAVMVSMSVRPAGMSSVTGSRTGVCSVAVAMSSTRTA